ncbi:hypothetical protein S40285_09294 [Stachybotrys chlorohalonatus IBT 40285]|uniref:Chitin-binding type-4 domain-containing protein n=1 Tax=Stachybotrys chlorohalonatus (strain IBT 40285) TaxID=1283841 RepID=A0A084Q801_STAC4|nr:hypothetical protein S40285_09294 [Stachybotrys chlorohalonata IBT 40285]
MFAKTAILSLFAAGVLGHAVVETPEPRRPGSASDALCGAAVSSVLRRDLAGPIEEASKVADADYACDVYACRGYQFEDNESALQTYQAGDVVSFHVDLIAGHRPGYANVSVVDPVNNIVIGEPLKTWAAWPVNNPGPDRDDINFNITIPDNLGSVCTEGGNCVIQWYWYATGNRQTYESCIDFIVA